MDATTPPSLADDIAEALAYANQGPSLSRETTRRLVRELTERTAGLDHLQRLFRLATRVEQRVGDAVECSCTWSYGRPGVRTARPADCPVHGDQVDERPTEPTEADPAKAWAERVRFTLTEIIDADEVAEWAAMDEPGVQRWHLLAASHEKLRALVGGRPALFALGEFTAHSGSRLGWKIDCDALTPADWGCLAAMAAGVLPPFGAVEGVPRGGLAFAEALAQHSVPGGRLLIADDVCTTGASLDEHRAGREAIGVVVFARGPVPAWVTPLLLVGGRPSAPTHDEIVAVVKTTRVGAEWDHVTDRSAVPSVVIPHPIGTQVVVALLSRSAAEPPDDAPDLSQPQGWEEIDTL